jgi:oligoribonuclease
METGGGVVTRDRANLIWIDLETTGLSVGARAILEIASIVTDKDLNILGEGPVLVVHQSEETLARIDPWSAQQHGNSGLLDVSRSSDISLAEAEQQTLRFVRRYVPRQVSPLCGSSVGLDRRFLMRYMPELNSHLNHRNLDVSTVAELAARWYPGVAAKLERGVRHRASDDIRDSIEELRFYRRLMFRE